MLEKLQSLPPDPILGLTVACRQDPNPKKADLGVGVYRDETGVTPVFAAVKEAEQRVHETQTTKAYVSPPGDERFLTNLVELLLGKEHPVVAGDRVGALQTPAGSGALRVLATLILRADPNAVLWLPNPTWGNHTPLLGASGIQIETYPFYAQSTHSIRWDDMIEVLSERGPGDVVLFHGCCHNPSGADFTNKQWDQIAQLADELRFTPLVDIAYQGLGRGLEEDAYGVRVLAEHAEEMLIAYSTSKNFGMYRDRAGMALAIQQTAVGADTTTSQMANIAREMYSMPPDHGAAVVGEVLSDPALTQSWKDELMVMRGRVNEMRQRLAEELRRATKSDEFDYIPDERGLFSFLGFTPDQMARLREEFSVYGTPSSRINVAGLTAENVAYVADSIATVRRQSAG